MRDFEMRFDGPEMVLIAGTLSQAADELEKQAAEAEKSGDTQAQHKRNLATERRALANRFVKVMRSLAEGRRVTS
jgi:hypothetical protein